MLVKMFFVVATMFPLGAIAQSVVVTKEASRVEGEHVTGYQTDLGESVDDMRASLSKYLKTFGKTKQSGDYLTVAEPIIGGKKYSQPLYATIKSVGATAVAWFGMLPDAGQEPSLERDLQKLVHDFGISFRREKIQLQIDESLIALQAVEKQQSRLVNQNKDLNQKIENNNREKIELEKSLITNKFELDDLNKRLEANAKAQDSVAIAADQIRKVVEMHKERQRKVR